MLGKCCSFRTGQWPMRREAPDGSVSVWSFFFFFFFRGDEILPSYNIGILKNHEITRSLWTNQDSMESRRFLCVVCCVFAAHVIYFALPHSRKQIRNTQRWKGGALQYVLVSSCTNIPKSVEISHPTYESLAISLDHNFLYKLRYCGPVLYPI